jgi:hypothetical protein
VAEIQKADPRALRSALLIVGGGVLLGVVFITIAGECRQAFETWLTQDLRARLRIVTAVLTLLTTGPILAIASYCWRLGGRIVRARRYPPAGLRTLRDTLVLTGEAADRRGRFLQVWAAVMGVAGLLLAFFLWRLVFLLGVVWHSDG